MCGAGRATLLRVDVLLLEEHEGGGGDHPARAPDQPLGRVEGLDQPPHVAAVAADVLDEHLGDPFGRPAELGEAGRDLAVEVVQTLRKETAVLRRERVQDGVVVADDEHHILPQAAVALAVRRDVHSDVRDLEVEALPVVHLRKELEERAVEVLLEETVALARRRPRQRRRAAHHEEVVEESREPRFDGGDPVGVEAADVPEVAGDVGWELGGCGGLGRDPIAE